MDRESVKYIWRGRKVWRGSVDKEVEVRARRVGGECGVGGSRVEKE